MRLGNSLYEARGRQGLTQEEVAGKLGVSRQTISKWEADETLPDIRQSKRLALLYHVTLDELIHFDLEVQEIQAAIDRSSEETASKVDWTKAWGKKYPVLVTYQERVDTTDYTIALKNMLDRLREDYGYGEQDAFLVLKDILAQIWFQRKKKK